MTARWVLVLAGAFAASGVGALAAALLTEPASAGVRASAPSVVSDTPRPPIRPTPTWAALAPFRMDRRLPAARFDARADALAAAAATAPSRPPRPVLALRGLVLGLHPAAVVEGWPGLEGARVVRRGDALGELRVLRVGEAGVVIAGMDTTWTLRLGSDRE